jgi:hypothetical protein
VFVRGLFGLVWWFAVFVIGGLVEGGYRLPPWLPRALRRHVTAPAQPGQATAWLHAYRALLHLS